MIEVIKMKINELLTEGLVSEVKQRLDAKCWKGKHKEGTKIKGGIRVNNCVPNESVEEGSDNIVAVIDGVRSDRTYNNKDHAHNSLAKLVSYGKAKVAELYVNGEKVEHLEIGKKDTDFEPKRLEMDEDWQKVNRKDKTAGMSKKAVKAYRRENPGSKLQTAVTTKPSKLKKGSKSAKRRKSFCSRMKGMKKSRTSAKTKRDPDSNINKALRRWNC